jgi:hypothetical protein
MVTKNKESYTQWWIKYPWHVSGELEGQYPSDEHGNCTCQCKGCLKHEHKATKQAHMS